MQDWRFEQDAAGRGVVKHHAPPRFVAHWTSGAADMAAPNVQCWSDAGSGDGEDSLHILGFQWIDSQPDAMTFERLMQDAAKAIDEWITSSL